MVNKNNLEIFKNGLSSSLKRAMFLEMQIACIYDHLDEISKIFKEIVKSLETISNAENKKVKYKSQVRLKPAK